MRTAATQQRRQSCDRCHGQKLRCTRLRNNSSSGACNRCLRQGTQCVYSFSLPKGRPSIYRVTDEASLLPPTLDMMETREFATMSDVDTSSQTCHMPVTGRSSDATPATTALSDSSAATAWSFLLDSPADWCSLQLSGSEAYQSQDLGTQPLFQRLSDNRPDFTSSSNRSENLGTEDELQCNTGWDCSTSSLEGSGPACFSDLSDHRRQDLDESIAQLSQLSTSLHVLYRTSRALAEKAASLQQQQQQDQQQRKTQLMDLIGDDVFALVTAWLAHPSGSTSGSTSGSMSAEDAPGRRPANPPTLGHMLVDAFSASSQLLGILQSLHAEAAFWPGSVRQSQPSAASCCSPSGAAEISSFLGQIRGHAPRSVAPSDRSYYSGIIHSLIATCHTQLLSIYVAVLTIFCFDVNITGSLGWDRMDKMEKTDITGQLYYGAQSEIADMRLVVVVQVCSFFCVRQCQKTDMYLRMQTATYESPDQYSAPGCEAMRELGADARRLIDHLRQALSI